MNFIPDLPTLATFTLASVLLTITPGPDMTLQISRALKEGPLSAFVTVIGTNLGICVHTMLVAFGVSALIIASPMAFLALKMGGAGYLFWLAIQALFKGSTFKVDQSGGKAQRGSLLGAGLNGFWVNILNPKVIIFFMTFLPQFVKASDPNVTGKLLFLGGFLIILALPFTISIILGAHRLTGWLQANPKVLRGIDYTFGSVFSAFAVKILTTHAR